MSIVDDLKAIIADDDYNKSTISVASEALDEILKLEFNISNLEAEVHNKSYEIAKLNHIIAALEGQLKAESQEIAKLQKQLFTADNLIFELSQE